MFGLSFGELVVVLLVAIVVIGPKELPRMLRKAGQWAGKLQRMAVDLRRQSGIDEVLRAEGLADDIRQISKLARGELDGVIASASAVTSAMSLRPDQNTVLPNTDTTAVTADANLSAEVSAAADVPPHGANVSANVKPAELAPKADANAPAIETV